MRQCESCDSFTTYIKKDGYAQWHCHDGHWLCHKCFDCYVWHPYRNPIDNKKWNTIKNGREMVFKKKRIVLSDRVLKGQCQICGKKRGDSYINCEGKEAKIILTSMHHFEYHDDDPLKDAIEVCNSCHMKESWKLGQVEVRNAPRNEKGQFTK
jgi:hypothetical protein